MAFGTAYHRSGRLGTAHPRCQPLAIACRSPGAFPARLGRVVATQQAARSSHQELLDTLQALTSAELEEWASSHQEQLTLSFLAWVADQEQAAGGDEEQRQQLWQLGSQLMALREGLSPVGMDTLQAELKAAAAELARSAPAAQTSGRALAAAPVGLTAAAQQTAALGLSVEGMALFQQQAAALETVIGTTRAQALTEIIGRKRVSVEEAQGVLAVDAAGRILEVLLSIDNRADRAATLPDAFTPTDNDASAFADYSTVSEEEEELSTTPLQLLQSIDLWLHRLQVGDSGLNPLPALAGGSSLVPQGEELLCVLSELREDVLAYWESTTADNF